MITVYSTVHYIISLSKSKPKRNCVVLCALCSVRVKSEHFEGPLSALAGGAAALATLEEPVARLDALAALVLSTLNACASTPTSSSPSAEEPADRQRGVSLAPRHWSQRDLNLRYAGRLEGPSPAGRPLRTRCEPVGVEQLLTRTGTTAPMETTSASSSSSSVASARVHYTAAECGICLEGAPADARDELYVELECGHGFCVRCLVRYVLLAARNLSGPVLKCPVCYASRHTLATDECCTDKARRT